jgi:hypothetical protein
MLFVVGLKDEVLEGIGPGLPLRLSLVVVAVFRLLVVVGVVEFRLLVVVFALVGVAVVCQSPT